MTDNNRHRLIASLLLLFFIGLQSGRMLCFHTHVYGNVVVSHSHPFNNPDRQHSTSELISLAVVAQNMLTDNLVATPELQLPVFFISKLFSFESSRIINSFENTSGDRAPPTLHV